MCRLLEKRLEWLKSRRNSSESSHNLKVPIYFVKMGKFFAETSPDPTIYWDLDIVLDVVRRERWTGPERRGCCDLQGSPSTGFADCAPLREEDWATYRSRPQRRAALGEKRPSRRRRRRHPAAEARTSGADSDNPNGRMDAIAITRWRNKYYYFLSLIIINNSIASRCPRCAPRIIDSLGSVWYSVFPFSFFDK